jgi:hypothetical protein
MLPILTYWIAVTRDDVTTLMKGFFTGSALVEHVTWNDVPLKFEAGTPAFVEAIGLGAAVAYLETLGMDAVRAHERELTAYTLASARCLASGSSGRLTQPSAQRQAWRWQYRDDTAPGAHGSRYRSSRYHCYGCSSWCSR